MSPKDLQILIVEDEAVVAMSIKQLIGIYGYSVAGVASNFSDAVRIAEEKLPDLVLMDIKIKGNKDGIEAANKIKEICGASVIFLTAYSSKETIDKCMSVNPSAYIVKPFKEQELRNAISNALIKNILPS
ncbi:MAG: response regulator [Methanomicrobiaceae archaeon]|nr:response regulator [Methanomicrobiaceae archaeon]